MKSSNNLIDLGESKDELLQAAATNANQFYSVEQIGLEEQCERMSIRSSHQSPNFGQRHPEQMHFDPEVELDMRTSVCFYQNQDQMVIGDI